MESFYLTLTVIVLSVFAIYQWFKHQKAKKRQLLYALDTPEEWLQYIENNVAIYHFLPKKLQRELLGHVHIFVAEKYFTGHNGLEITDEIRVTIAAQACLLLLNRKTNYFPHLKTIRVYPGGFKNPKLEDKLGHNLGESWTRGPVILSWKDSVQGGQDAQDGKNVVIHEFAHQLDQLDGAADGRPLINPAQIRAWGKVMSKEFKSLRVKTKLRNHTFFNEYGATNPAEFFAVISEHFYEQPKTFQEKHPDLYELLVDYYKVDPATWLSDSK